MAFTATITFTGICGIVPKINPTGNPSPAGGFRVLLPNGFLADPSAVKTSNADGFSRIKRHAAFVKLTDYPATGDPGLDIKELLFFKGHHLKLTPTFENLQTHAPEWGNIAGLASYENVATSDNHGLLSAKAATTSPTYPLIAGQITSDFGTLNANPGNASWIFDQYLRSSGGVVSRKFTHEVTLTLDRLANLKFELIPFSSTTADRSFTFTQGPALITVANLCDINPLQWGNLVAPDRLLDDEDFRLHYEIVDKPSDIANKLGNAACPIPRPGNPLSAGKGLNCFPMRFPEVP